MDFGAVDGDSDVADFQDAGEGRTVPRTRLPVSITASGPVDLIGVCNGDPTDHTTMKPADPAKASIAVFNGLAQVVVRSRRNTPGAGTVRVISESAGSASVRISTR